MPPHKVNRRHYLRYLTATAGVLCLPQLGCANKQITQKSAAADLLQAPKASKNSMALEFATVRIVPYRSRLVQEMWGQIDQQAIELDIRKNLVRNGIRVGIAGQILPPALRALIKPEVLDRSELTDIQLEMLEKGMLDPSPVVNSHTRITMQPNQSRDLPIVDARPSLTWQWQDENGQQHHHLTDAVSMIRATIEPLSRSVVSLGLLPLVKHGKMQPQFNALNEELAFQIAQSEQLLQPARLNCQLRSGETLVLGPAIGAIHPNSETANLGQAFFQSPGSVPNGAGAHQTLMLLRFLDSNTSEIAV